PGGPQAAERSSVGGGDKGPGPPDLPSPSRAVRGHRRTGPHSRRRTGLTPREDRIRRRVCGGRGGGGAAVDGEGGRRPGDAGAAVVPSSQGVGGAVSRRDRPGPGAGHL